MAHDRVGSIPGVTLQPDWMDNPYGIWQDYGYWETLGKSTHLALHPGLVQHQSALLATLALNGQDTLDGFSIDLESGQNNYPGLATNLLLPLYADEFVVVFPDEPGTVSPWSVPSEKFAQDLPLGATFALRVGNGELPPSRVVIAALAAPR